MDFEFHYYITGYIANRAGFSVSDSKTIAYASQFVDHNYMAYDVADPKEQSNCSAIGKDLYTGEVYSNYISQTKNIFKPRLDMMRIHTLFHFVPGDPLFSNGRRKDGKMHWLNTTPNSILSQQMITGALDTGNLYRIGIASHTYADTWAHQNFVGLNDNFNGFAGNHDLSKMNLLKRLVSSTIPNLGHSDAFLHPDRVGRKWTDPRLLNSEIDNNERFILAAENLFYQYVRYLKDEEDWLPLWLPVKQVLLYIMEKKKQSARIHDYLTIMPWLPVYNKDLWFDLAIKREVRGLKDFINEILPGFTMFKDKYWWRALKEETDWYNFQEAVKEHQKAMLPVVNGVFKMMGKDIRKC